MNMMDHLLSLILFLPLLGIPVILILPGRFIALARWIALGFVSLSTVLIFILYGAFQSGAASGGPADADFRFIERIPWLPEMKIEYLVGVDSLSLFMVVLIAIVSIVAIVVSWNIKNPRGYFVLFLFQYTGMIGVFIALDLFLFYIFWEVTLLPMYFLIGFWGGARKEYAAIKFFLYTLFGSLFMLVAIIALYFLSDVNPLPGAVAHSFDLIALRDPAVLASPDIAPPLAMSVGELRNLLWLFFFLGFAVKIPIVPLHTWLPDAHVEAPTPISVLLAAVLLKMGLYGILRVNYPLLPEETLLYAPYLLAFIGVVNVIYGSFNAFKQNDLKRMVAFSSIAHMGFAMLGMASFTAEGLSGSVYQMISHGLISAMLFIITGILYERAGHREIDRFGGLASLMPRLAAITGLAFFAGLAMPGFSSFVAELLCLVGAFRPYPVLTMIGATGIILSAAYFLSAYQRIFFGEKRQNDYRDLSLREWITLSPLAALTLLLGVYPAIVMETLGSNIASLMRLLEPVLMK